MKKSLSSIKYKRLLSWLVAGRDAQGWTIRDLAEMLGESRSVVGKIETGERRLDVFEYVQYCEALELEPEEGLKFLK